MRDAAIMVEIVEMQTFAKTKCIVRVFFHGRAKVLLSNYFDVATASLQLDRSSFTELHVFKFF